MNQMIEGLDNEVTFILLFITLLLAIVIPLYVLKPNRNLNNNFNSQSNEDNTQQSRSQSSSSSSQDRPTAMPQPEPGTSSPIYCDGYNNGTRPPEINTDHVPGTRSDDTHEKMINVRVLHQETYRQMNVSHNIKLKDFKEACFPNEFTAGKCIRMIFAGKILQGDTYPLRYLGIMNGSVVHCVISEQNNSDGRNNEPTSIPTNLDMSDYLMHLVGLSLIGTWTIFILWTNFMSTTSIAILVFLTLIFIGWTIYS